MNLDDRYIPIEDIPSEMIPPMSRIVSNGNKVRINDCLMEVISINDKNGTVTYRLAGVFPPKAEEHAGN